MRTTDGNLAGFGPHERERVALLRLFSAHPHCFGSATYPELQNAGASVGVTAYESIERVEYDDVRHALHMMVRLARPLPGLGDPCRRDALGYVRCFVDQGGGWEDAGLAAFDPLEVLAAASSESRAGSTLYHRVELRFEPRRRPAGVTRFRVRAVVAWSARPPADSPGWLPRWGDVAEQEIALPPVVATRSATRRERSESERGRGAAMRPARRQPSGGSSAWRKRRSAS